jgi:hypothetical protein
MIDRVRWILLGAAMLVVAVAFSWNCGGGGGGATVCPTFPGGIPITACGTASPQGPFLEAISICPGPPPSPTPVSTSTAAISPTPMETTCPAAFVTAVPAQGTVQFHAVGTFSDGATQDITNSASTTWTTTNSSVVSPNANPLGSYFAAGAGCASINATSGGVTGSPAVVVDVPPIPSGCPTPGPPVGSVFGP